MIPNSEKAIPVQLDTPRSWTATYAHPDGYTTNDKPEFARFRMIINFLGGSNPKGYKEFFSLEWNKQDYMGDELRGLQQLLRQVMSWGGQVATYQGQYRQATVYMSLSNDTRTNAKPYTHEWAYIQNGLFVRRSPIIFEWKGRHRRVDLQRTVQKIKINKS